MTRKRKLGIAAVVVVAIVAVLLLARDDEPVIAAKFLRSVQYDGQNALAEFQITNLSRSAVSYGIGAIPSISTGCYSQHASLQSERRWGRTANLRAALNLRGKKSAISQRTDAQKPQKCRASVSLFHRWHG